MTFKRQTPARYLRTGVSPSSGEPALYGTMGRGQPCYVVDLFARPYVSTREESVGGYPLGEQTVMDIPLNRALLDLHDHGILADVHRLRQGDHKEQQLKRWNRRLERHEEFVLAERREYYEEKRKLAKMRIDIEERFKRAKVATRINDIIERIEPDREPIRWPQPGSVVPTINAGAGPSDNPQKCGYCGFWDHRSDRCETPHYLCSYTHDGRCLVHTTHRHYYNNLPQTCIYGGRQERRPPQHDDIADEQDFGNTLYNNKEIE